MNARTESQSTLSSRALFDLWAEEYDSQNNVLLSLEGRIVEALIPNLTGLDALDAGCGTGRLFACIHARSARTLTGVDHSPAMLEHAEKNNGATVRLGSCTSLPLDDNSIDFTISSFVVSYIDDLSRFVSELKRVSRLGARVIVSDIHPQTAAKFCWKRSFRSGTEVIDIPSNMRPLQEIINAFCASGWSLFAQLECPFSSEELKHFECAGRAKSFWESVGRPAIYVCIFALGESPNEPQLAITGAHCALSAFDRAPQTIVIDDEKMRPLSATSHFSAQRTIALDGYLILPGLINAHDHLQFALFPRMGMGPYENAGEWASDIHQTETDRINLHRTIPRDVRIWWGGIRNLLCGVTTVCHHDSLSPSMRTSVFPVCVVERMTWAHSLMFEPNMASRAANADLTTPFVLHAAEGKDAMSAAEVERLDRMGALNDRTVIVHGLALDGAAVERLNARRVSLVCCPSSNEFLFHQTPSNDILRKVNSLALGSDSPLTAVGDLLDELQYTRKHIELAASELYRMVFTAPAEILRLSCGEGRLMPGGVADLIATIDTGDTPAKMLAGMTWREVELVVRRGRVFLASEEVYRRLPSAEVIELRRLSIEGETRWVRAPLEWLFSGAANVARDGALSLGGKAVRHG